MSRLNNVTIVTALAALTLGVAYAGPQMLHKADADADGFISMEEFRAAHAERIEKHFSMIDADGDGLISEQEMQDAAAARHATHERKARHMRERNPEKLIEKLDQDGSGSLSLTELEDRRFAPDADSFSAADADGSGELDATELEQLISAARENRRQRHERNYQ